MTEAEDKEKAGKVAAAKKRVCELHTGHKSPLAQLNTATLALSAWFMDAHGLFSRFRCENAVTCIALIWLI